MEIIFFSMAGICAIYFIIIVAYSGISTPFCGIWLILAAVFMMMGAFRARSHAKKGSMPRRLPIFVYTSFMMALCIFGATMYLVVSGTRQRPEGGLDYVVVVGDRVYDEGISNALRLKLDRAADYFLHDPGTVLVLSGGQKDGDPVPEALAMYNYLRLKGIPDASLLMEMSSEHTRENIELSLYVIEHDIEQRNSGLPPGRKRKLEDMEIGILTTDFNMYRAMRYAREAGYPEVYGISTDTDPILYPHECVKESCALVGDILTGGI